MIKEVAMYTIICDGCGKDVCEDTEHAGWNDKSYVEDIASEDNWIKFDDYGGTEHYCPKCYEYDDDNNLVIKKKQNNEHNQY